MKQTMENVLFALKLSIENFEEPLQYVRDTWCV